MSTLPKTLFEFWVKARRRARRNASKQKSRTSYIVRHRLSLYIISWTPIWVADPESRTRFRTDRSDFGPIRFRTDPISDRSIRFRTDRSENPRYHQKTRPFKNPVFEKRPPIWWLDNQSHSVGSYWYPELLKKRAVEGTPWPLFWRPRFVTLNHWISEYLKRVKRLKC